jgi:hypothetical protein
MPRMMSTDDTMQTQSIGGMQAFQFSGKRVEHLGATEYTLATIAVDLTGSVVDFCKALREALATSIAACKKSPRANNLLLRVVFFNSSIGVYEQHGFKPLGEIDVDEYPDLVGPYESVATRKARDGTEIRPQKVYGSTNLFDATFSAVGATNGYAKTLMDQEFLANGIVIVITDGDDNASSATTSMIKQEIDRGAKAESIESLIPILVGINAAGSIRHLNAMAKEVGMQFLDAGDATPGKLAKLASFVSQSVSSQSQSLGTGGPSTAIAATI